MVELTGDEQDSLAANCGACWAYPGNPCRVVHKNGSLGKTRRRPHKTRVQRAGRRGILGGVGRMLLAQKRKVDA